MHVYVVSSKNLTNIWAGIGARRWAVSQAQGDNVSIQTKAKNLPVGALGVIYCVDIQSFTTPFVVTSKPDLAATITDIWPEPWTLPFSLFPLGSPRRQVHKDRLATLLPSLKSGGQWDQLLHVAPVTVFAPSQLTDDDWSALAGQLIEG
jgi:hypothetical protein